MSRIRQADVEHVARLARLALREEELRDLASDLDQILDYAELLQELDTRSAAPMSHALSLPTPMREDRPVAPLDPELAVANAPDSRAGAFLVPRVIEGEEEG